jgi:exodeoxyribonuclease III
MQVRLVTWNINSVRLRIGLLERLVAETKPDIVCLQEIKCSTDVFPVEAVHAMGLTHLAVRGQPGYHGVAVLSRLPLVALPSEDFNGTGEARHQGVRVKIGKGNQYVQVHNAYVPSGGDEPDVGRNPKFQQKLTYMAGMERWSAGLSGSSKDPAILVGDLNIAPLEHDVWSHKQLLNVVSHTPIEVEKFNSFIAAHDWQDVMRGKVPSDQKLYTWWSYRSSDWRASNRGRRLDHVLVSRKLSGACTSMSVLDHVRDWEKTSDHAPVVADFDFA